MGTEYFKPCPCCGGSGLDCWTFNKNWYFGNANQPMTLTISGPLEEADICSYCLGRCFTYQPEAEEAA